jgi:hypothetical protein
MWSAPARCQTFRIGSCGRLEWRGRMRTCNDYGPGLPPVLLATLPVV